MAVVRGKVFLQIRQIEESIYTAEHMVRGRVFVEVEGVKQSVLIAAALSHHAGALPSMLPQLRPLQRNRSTSGIDRIRQLPTHNGTFAYQDCMSVSCHPQHAVERWTRRQKRD